MASVISFLKKLIATNRQNPSLICAINVFIHHWLNDGLVILVKPRCGELAYLCSGNAFNLANFQPKHHTSLRGVKKMSIVAHPPPCGYGARPTEMNIHKMTGVEMCAKTIRKWFYYNFNCAYRYVICMHAYMFTCVLLHMHVMA